MPETPRLLVVEDDPVLRKAIVCGLSTRWQVIDAGSVAVARRAIGTTAGFAAAILDVGLPDGSGLELVPALRAGGAAVVMLTVVDDVRTILCALRAGAVGWLVKTDLALSPEAALEAALAGGSPLSPRVARALLTELAASSPPAPPENLTSREREILDLFVSGLTYAEVADVLGISVNTVRTHVKSVYQKLDVSTKAEAIARMLGRQ